LVKQGLKFFLPQPTNFNPKRLSVEFCKPFYKEELCLICGGNSGYPKNIPRHFKSVHIEQIQLYWESIGGEVDPEALYSQLVNPSGSRQQSVAYTHSAIDF